MISNSTIVVKPKPGCVDEWKALLYAGEKLFLAGARMRLGPNADLKAEYRRWYEEEMREHDALVARVYERLESAEAEHGDAS